MKCRICFSDEKGLFSKRKGLLHLTSVSTPASVRERARLRRGPVVALA